MKVYRVWYWDSCNGMNSRSQDRGLFASRASAQAYIEPRIQGEDNWDKDAYRIQEIEVRDA